MRIDLTNVINSFQDAKCLFFLNLFKLFDLREVYWKSICKCQVL